MNPVSNPYAPGAGTPPAELAGRDELREKIRISIERIRLRRPAKSIIMVGLRGVGKTVLLDRIRDDAEACGIQTVRIEAPESRSLPALLAPQLRQAMLRLSRNKQAKALANRALRGLAGFATALKVKYADIEVGLDFEPEPGLADNGDLELDLQDLIEAVGHAAAKANTALVLFIDELQYVQEKELAALITALHCAAQRKLPVTLLGAGLCLHRDAYRTAVFLRRACNMSLKDVAGLAGISLARVSQIQSNTVHDKLPGGLKNYKVKR